MTARQSMDFSSLISLVEEGTKSAVNKLNNIREQGDKISIADMFELQVNMNALTQRSETATAVVAAMHQSIMSSLSKISR